jgi:multimeric flavodoxin WrbA
MMKVAALTGSPRKDGNTSVLIDLFLGQKMARLLERVEKANE